MEAGEIDAVAFAPHAHMSFGTIDNAQWWTANLNPGTVHCPVVVNSDALASLSEGHRSILLDSVDDALSHYIKSYEVETMERWQQELDDRNIEVVEFSGGDISVLSDLSISSGINSWMAWSAEHGVPSQSLFNELVTTINEGM